MFNLISIVFAHRNRGKDRIRITFESLQRQQLQNFEVIFVDYGSEDVLVLKLQDLAAKFDFVKVHSLKTSQLLWNKSKALNYGIKKANGEYVFIADTDLVFHPKTTEFLQNILAPEKFLLFKLGYLARDESQKLKTEYNFDDLKPARFGKVNGMILTSRESLLKVSGLDEFFHFYGAEDEDLFIRLEHAGYRREANAKSYFYHNWHKSFSGSEDELLTGNPRVKNIMRINQRHFYRNRERNIIKPLQQKGMGEIISPNQIELLNHPAKTFKITNIISYVEHFLREEMPSYKGEIIKVIFFEDPDYNNLKYRLKSLLRKQSPTYNPMKSVNDLLLKEILFNYRNFNYSLKIARDLKSITFIIQL